MARPSRSGAPRDRPAFLAFLAPLAALLLGCWGEPPAPPPQHALVLVGLDGFRADYLDSLPAPNLRALAAVAIGVVPVIPGFLHAATTEGGVVADPDFLDQLYRYGVFVAFGLAAVSYSLMAQAVARDAAAPAMPR